MRFWKEVAALFLRSRKCLLTKYWWDIPVFSIAEFSRRASPWKIVECVLCAQMVTCTLPFSDWRTRWKRADAWGVPSDFKNAIPLWIWERKYSFLPVSSPLMLWKWDMTSLWQHVPVDAQFSGLILGRPFSLPPWGSFVSLVPSPRAIKWEPPFINWVGTGEGVGGGLFSAAGGGLPEWAH